MQQLSTTPAAGQTPMPLIHGSNPLGRQILTFTLGMRSSDSEPASTDYATDYGIDLADVQEIRGYTHATPIPNTPPYIKGAINLRGAVIPIIDLRIRFGVSSPQYTKFTVVIVVCIGGKTVGLVADGVSDVLSLRLEEIMAPPDFGGANGTDCVDGIATVEAKLVLMLNLRKMLAPDGLADPEAIQDRD